MAKGDIKRRREIERISASLPSMTPAQEWEAQKVRATAWVGKRKAWCDACGHEYDSDLWEHPRKKHTVCPKCGARCEVKRSPGKRTETIEIDTKAWKIVQCRGKHNRPSVHHGKILNLMNKNMDKFRRMAQ